MKPNTQVPDLHLPLINDTEWTLKSQRPDAFTLLVFYRGLHCPVCKKQLQEVAEHLDKLVERGVYVTAISMDTEKRAKKAGEEWNIPNLPVAYNLSQEQAKSYGLYLSKAISDKEPDVFSEPGMFLIKPDGSLYFSSVQNAPFTRPAMSDLIKAIDFIKKEDYPARGTY
jgi:peroxiredoxin